MPNCRFACLSVCAMLLLPQIPTANAKQHEVSVESARQLLFAALPDTSAQLDCNASDVHENISCFIAARYKSDPTAAKLATNLYAVMGVVAGLLPETHFNGGYRGTIHLVPQLPLGPLLKHLQFVAGALLEIDEFLARLNKEADGGIHYQWHGFGLRFFSSIKKRTPAAFAGFTDGWQWQISYNTNGTLNYSKAIVLELLFHELFHLNDLDHNDWSRKALTPTFDAIVKRCGTEVGCLKPYAPGWVKVRGGTFYAFTLGNGVREFAAEVAIQYLREQSIVMKGGTVKMPYKCGPQENATAWELTKNEFFGGIDMVPHCAVARRYLTD